MKYLQQTLLGITALASLGLTTTAMAYCDGGRNAAPDCMHEQGKMMAPVMAGRDKYSHLAMIDKRLDKLKTDLQITTAQETAWQAFVAKSRQQAEETRAMHEKMMPNASATMTSAPERMEKHLEMMKQRMTHMEAMTANLKEFYAVLTPDQKAVADKHFSHMMEQRKERIKSAIKDTKSAK